MGKLLVGLCLLLVIITLYCCVVVGARADQKLEEFREREKNE